MEYFLTQSHRGYCMHFASAAVLMLRYANIPARYVAGYVADVPASGRALVPDSNAHAWVEIYLDGYGWEPVEVTPIYTGGTPGQSGGLLTPEPTPTPMSTPTATLNPNAARPTPTPQTVRPAEEPDVDFRLLLLPLCALLIPLALFLRRTLSRRERARRFGQSDPNRAAIAGYLYLRRLERWGGTVSESVTELAKKAKFSPHTLTEEERDAVLSAARAAAVEVDKALPWYQRLWCRYVLGLL